METKEKISGYLAKIGKANAYRIASALKMNVLEVTEALDKLGQEGKAEISGGVATLAKEPAKVSQEIVKEKIQALEEKQIAALAKLKEALKILEE